MRRLLIPALCLHVFAQAPEIRSTAADRKALSITVYQNDLAAVRDMRRVTLPAGESTLAFADLAAKIRSKSAYLLNPPPGLKVLERNFEFNLLSPTALKLAGLNQRVALRDGRTGELRWGTQISVPYPNGVWNSHATALQKMTRMPQAWIVQPNNNILIQGAEGVEASEGQSPAYARLPPTLRSSPTLLQTIRSQSADSQDLTLLYTTEGLSWNAHYIATLDTDAKHLDLDAFATIKNESGIAYPDTAFQLVAGEPNKVYDPEPSAEGEPQVDMTAMATVEVVADTPPEFQEERLSEYPLFTLDRPTTLKDNQTKQLALFHAERVPLKIRAEVITEDSYEPDEDHYLKGLKGWLGARFEDPPVGRIAFVFPMKRPVIQMEGHIKNTKAAHLGRALPSGIVDIRYQDPGGALLPMDRQAIEGTPAGEDIILPLPPGKGMAATRTIRSLKVVSRRNAKALVLRITVAFTNGSSHATDTVIQEPFFPGWEVLSSNFPGHRGSGTTYEFSFRSKPHSTMNLSYLVRTAYQD